MCGCLQMQDFCFSWHPRTAILLSLPIPIASISDARTRVNTCRLDTEYTSVLAPHLHDCKRVWCWKKSADAFLLCGSHRTQRLSFPQVSRCAALAHCQLRG